MRCKAVQEGAKHLRLVEFSHKFVEAHWCEKGHVGYVLAGELEVDFAGQLTRFPEGSALVIPAGPDHAHKARAVTPTVLLFLVEEISV